MSQLLLSMALPIRTRPSFPHHQSPYQDSYTSLLVIPSAAAPDLGLGVAPLGRCPDLGRGVAQTTTQLHASHTLVKWCLKFSKPGFNAAPSQQYMNREIPDVQAGFRKGRETRDQIANIRWIMEKAREFQNNIYFCFIDYAKAFDCVDHNQLWKILKEVGIPDPLTCLLRNLYAGQKTTVRTGHGTTDWFQIGGVWKGCILSPCLFNLYA